MKKVYKIEKDNYEDAGQASRDIKMTLKTLGLDPKVLKRVSIACYVNGSQTILDLLVEMTGAPVNGTSADGVFSIDATRCVGACGLAPVVSVDGTVFGCTKQLEDLKMLVLDYKKEEAPA